jgi:parallel beta-helix repeat protein
MALNNNGLKWPLELLFSIIIIYMVSMLASAAIITVGPGESIQAAIDKASPGDTIEVKSGSYEESIDVNKRLTLIGIDAGIGAPVIDSARINADSCELSGFKFENPVGFGISVLSDYNNITDNKVEACTGGIFLKNCRRNVIAHNEARVICQGLMGFLRGDGIHLLNSHDNIIRNNVVEDGFIGIYMDSSSRNLVEDNHACNNTNGIGLLTSIGNTIKNNILRDNSDDGLGILKFSNDSVIEGNTVENSGDCGIYLQDSSHNAIYLNSFVGNMKNAISKDARSKGASNQWHSPKPISYSTGDKSIKSYLGNYWSDYNGGDSDGDGVGDASHKFDGGQDDYPLIMQWDDFINA